MLAGGLAGAVAFHAEPTLKQTALGNSSGKLIFSDLLGIPYWQGGCAYWYRPWRSDLGQDCDGYFAEPGDRVAERATGRGGIAVGGLGAPEGTWE